MCNGRQGVVTAGRKDKANGREAEGGLCLEWRGPVWPSQGHLGQLRRVRQGAVDHHEVWRKRAPGRGPGEAKRKGGRRGAGGEGGQEEELLKVSCAHRASWEQIFWHCNSTKGWLGLQQESHQRRWCLYNMPPPHPTPALWGGLSPGHGISGGLASESVHPYPESQGCPCSPTIV